MLALERVLARCTTEWMALPGVVGIGVGDFEGRPCITVLTAHSTPELRRRIPAEVDGYPVRIVESGTLRARGVTTSP